MTVALPAVPTAWVVTVKVAEIAEAAIVAVGGTVSAGLVFVRLMTAPPAGAACDKVTVQIAEEFEGRAVGAHKSEETDAGTTRFTILNAALPL